MTDKERVIRGAQERGLEPSTIGATVQWTMASGKTCIQHFTESGEWVKTEWV